MTSESESQQFCPLEFECCISHLINVADKPFQLNVPQELVKNYNHLILPLNPLIAGLIIFVHFY